MEPAEEPPAPEQVDENLTMKDAACPNQAPVVPSAAPAAHVPGTADASGMFSFCLDTGGAPALASLLMAFCFIQEVPGRSATWIPGSPLPGGGPRTHPEPRGHGPP